METMYFDDLLEENKMLKDEILKLKEAAEKFEALAKHYEEQLRLALQELYGKSSEQTVNEEQVEVVDESKPELETITYSRKKRKGKRKDDISNLPVETIEYTIPESERMCKKCGSLTHFIRFETHRELKIIPAQVSIVEHKKAVYTCRPCEREGISTTFITAKAPEPIIKGSLASPSSVAHIMVQKFVNHLPLYRQEKEFMYNDISLSRQTMANWVIKCSEDWLEPIYELMKIYLLKHKVLHADETVLQVLKELGKAARTNSYMWLYRTSGDASQPVIVYEYQASRAATHPMNFLNSFTGYLHTDGYQAYHTLQNITIVGCWTHARRKFDEALKVTPAEKRKGSTAEMGLNYCNRLFKLEKEFENLPPQERYQKRLEQSLPIAEAFLAWANSINTLPKLALGRAIKYLNDQWPYLKNVYLDGRLEVSNNRAERSIKPFVMGRKNWLFCNTPRGAKASAVVFSIIETAKENNLKPFKYLEFLLETVPNTALSNLDELLPWSASVPDNCKRLIKTKEQSHGTEKH